MRAMGPREMSHSRVIYTPAHRAMAIHCPAGCGDGHLWVRECFMAFATTVFPEHVPRLPFLHSYPGLVILQINHPPHKSLFTDDLSTSTGRTSFGRLRYGSRKRTSPFRPWRPLPA